MNTHLGDDKSHLEHSNVFSLKTYKERKVLAPTLRSYQSYLKLLTSGQLLTEVKVLMEEIKNRTLGQLEFAKGEVLMSEVGVRLSKDASILHNQIEKMLRDLQKHFPK